MSVNRATLIGNLTRDPELKYTPSGTAVCSFSIACNERFKDRDGNKQEKVEYLNVVAWRQLAEICGKFLHKGKQVYIDGKIQTRTYDDRDGNKKYITEIVADQMQMLGSKDDHGGQSSGYQATTHKPAQQPSQQRQTSPQPNNPEWPDDSDEIPF